LDGVHRLLIVGVFFYSLVVSCPSDIHHLTRGGNDTQRLLEGFEHLLFFSVPIVHFYGFHLLKVER